jgi:hypothetical protein
MNINKLKLPATILIASIILGGFILVTQIIKQQSIERQQRFEIEQKKQEQVVKEIKEKQAKEENQKALEACLFGAETNYNDNWYDACEIAGKLTKRCIEIHNMTYDDYLNENPPSHYLESQDYLEQTADFNKEKEGCSCSLPSIQSNRIDKARQDDKDECFKKYPQN